MSRKNLNLLMKREAMKLTNLLMKREAMKLTQVHLQLIARPSPAVTRPSKMGIYRLLTLFGLLLTLY